MTPPNPSSSYWIRLQDLQRMSSVYYWNLKVVSILPRQRTRDYRKQTIGNQPRERIRRNRRIQRIFNRTTDAFRGYVKRSLRQAKCRNPYRRYLERKILTICSNDYIQNIDSNPTTAILIFPLTEDLDVFRESWTWDSLNRRIETWPPSNRYQLTLH